VTLALLLLWELSCRLFSVPAFRAAAPSQIFDATIPVQEPCSCTACRPCSHGRGIRHPRSSSASSWAWRSEARPRLRTLYPLLIGSTRSKVALVGDT